MVEPIVVVKEGRPTAEVVKGERGSVASGRLGVGTGERDDDDWGRLEVAERECGDGSAVVVVVVSTGGGGTGAATAMTIESSVPAVTPVAAFPAVDDEESGARLTVVEEDEGAAAFVVDVGVGNELPLAVSTLVPMQVKAAVLALSWRSPDTIDQTAGEEEPK